jgi:Lon protease-like protein
VPVVPLFPLSYVLLPGAPLPLHIFERRYRQLLADIAAGAHRAAFGVVGLVSGTETSRNQKFANIGTMAEILEQEPYPDGSCDLLTVGSSRFQIHEVDRTTKPYLQAEVSWFDEEEGDVDATVLATCRQLCETYIRTLDAVSGRSSDVDLAHDAVALSYQIAGRLQLTAGDRQNLLAASTAAERLADGLQLMRREITLLQRTRTVPVAPQALRIVPSSS